jgi:hypothetical protein
MRELSKNYSVWFWVTVIVVSELIAFTLLQKSVDSPKNANTYIAISIFLFGLGVTLPFRETLKGNKIAVSNLYWIIASSLGSFALGYFAFNQSLGAKEYAGIALLILATAIQVAF